MISNSDGDVKTMKRDVASAQIGRALAVLFMALGLYSCQKVVSVDLNQSSPQIVIQGQVSDQGGLDSVIINMTGDYFTPSISFPPVTGATVVISEDAGEVDTLREIGSGKYYSPNPKGIPGTTYAMTVLANGKEYNAVSQMPQRVKIDSFYATSGESPFGRRTFYNFTVKFKDPPELGNYYRIVPHADFIPADSLFGDNGGIFLYDDEYTSGNEVTFQFRLGGTLSRGDTIGVDLLCIDHATYEYFRTLRTTIQTDRSPTSLAPANPTSNINNGALGYFSAYTIDSRKTVLK